MNLFSKSDGRFNRADLSGRDMIEPLIPLAFFAMRDDLIFICIS